MTVQVITIPHERYDAYCNSSDFIRKHIFPGGHLPSVPVLKEFATKNGLRLDHCRDIGPHYTVTLREWRRRFTEQYDRILALGYDRAFIRKFVWYFVICESSFRAKMIGNHHLRWVKAADTEPTRATKGPLRSGLYVGTVKHARRQVNCTSEAAHRFSYPVMMAYLDLGELDRVFAGRWFWGVDRWAPIAFHRADHFGPKDVPLDTVLRDAVEKKAGRRPTGPITVLTHLRYMGYCFNPITVFYCWTPDGAAVESMVLHVTNTPWQEDVLYVLPAEEGKACRSGTFEAEFPKALHVSPFLSMDYIYKLIASVPGRTIDVTLENHRVAENGASQHEASKVVPFVASVHLERREMTPSTLARFLCYYPILTWQVQLWIHWQAILLFLKGVRVHEVPHPDYALCGSSSLRSAVDLLKHLVLFAGALLWVLPATILRAVGF